jgi:hypothetical protein
VRNHSEHRESEIEVIRLNRRGNIVRTLQRTVVIISATVFALIAQTPTATSNEYKSDFKAYINIGANTVVLPDLVRTGDMLVIASLSGKKVFEQRVSAGAFSINPRDLNPGLYVLNVVRDNETMASVRVALAAK